ncbi:MAG: Gfo/Idh/MocA family protein [Candidatus Thorarchaeota archaeon]
MKILMIGLGSIGKRHTTNLKKLGYHDLIAYRSRPEKMEFCLKNDITEYFTFEEAINENPQVVFLTNPTSMHVPMALKVLERTAAHLFIEKPISNSLEGLDKFNELVQEKAITTMVGYNMRFHPLLRKIRDILLNGGLGEVVGYRSMYGEYLPNWHPWEDYRKGYSAREELGGGSLLTLSHDIDTAIWLFGHVKEAHGHLSEKRVLSTNTDECSIINLKHENGIIGSIFLDYIQDPPKRTLEIIAEKGKIFWDYYSNSLTVFDRIKKQEKVFHTPKNYVRNDMFVEEVNHFLKCVKNRETPFITLNDGKMVLDVVLKVK